MADPQQNHEPVQWRATPHNSLLQGGSAVDAAQHGAPGKQAVLHGTGRKLAPGKTPFGQLPRPEALKAPEEKFWVQQNTQGGP